MRKGLLMMVLLSGLALAGCDKPKDDMMLGERSDITHGAMSGENMGVDQGYGNTAGTPIPGSNEDLIVNVGDRVYFGYDRYDLTPEAMNQIQMQARWLQQYPSVNIVVEGHADERGTREYNLALGERRANAVRDYMIGLGVPSSRISTISYGKEMPEVLGSNPQSWARNRRAVTKVQ